MSEEMRLHGMGYPCISNLTRTVIWVYFCSCPLQTQ